MKTTKELIDDFEDKVSDYAYAREIEGSCNESAPAFDALEIVRKKLMRRIRKLERLANDSTGDRSGL